MRFFSTEIEGAYLIEPERLEDERGAFARLWCREQFERLGLVGEFRQASVSFNRLAGTIRGLHGQRAPHEEAKLVRCTAGAIHDVIVDVRPASRSYLKWESFELTAANGVQLYVPPGCLHGFQTLRDGAEVLYHISAPYRAEMQAGCRWNDPAFGVAWPCPPTLISPRDASFPDFAAPQLEFAAS